MGRIARSELNERLREVMRAMFFTNETIEWVMETMPLGAVRSIIDAVEHELGVRQMNKRAKLYRKARFPTLKSIDEYDFSEVAFPENYTKDDLLTLDFVELAQDFVFHGKTGRGKTHLAIALGQMCIEQEKEVRFFTAAELVLALTGKNKEGKLESYLKDIGKCEMLIVDELGYVPIDIEGARLLYQVIADCYEKRTLIVTTNIEFSKWGTILGDEKLAAAMIDRIVHHGRLVEFNGTSKRMDAALMLGRAQE